MVTALTTKQKSEQGAAVMHVLNNFSHIMLCQQVKSHNDKTALKMVNSCHHSQHAGMKGLHLP